MLFVWDKSKNRINIRKHGLSFEKAVRVFNDLKMIEVYDQNHSGSEEDRWSAVGSIGIVIKVVYTIRNDAIRIIPARRATKGETNEYYKDYELR